MTPRNPRQASNTAHTVGDYVDRVQVVDDDGSIINFDDQVINVADSTAKVEDVPAASGDSGIPILAVRNDAAASKTNTDGDYSMLATDAAGRVGIADLGGSVSVDDNAGSLTVDGTFWQATQPVSGTVTANAGTGPWPVTDNGGSLTVDGGVTATTNADATPGAAVPAKALLTAGSDGTNARTFATDSAGIAKVDIAGQDITVAVKQTAATATVTQVASSASSVTLQALNTARRDLKIFNDSTAVLYVKFGTTASTTSYTVQVPAGGFYEMGALTYTGRVDGIWASANGNAYVTETA